MEIQEGPKGPLFSVRRPRPCCFSLSVIFSLWLQLGVKDKLKDSFCMCRLLLLMDNHVLGKPQILLGKIFRRNASPARRFGMGRDFPAR